MSKQVICVKGIEGYITEGKEYTFEKIESYAGRAVIKEDDTGREGHYLPERFEFDGLNLTEITDV